MRTSFAVIFSNAPATKINAGLIDNMPVYVEKGEINVLSAKIIFSSTNANVNDIKITELNLFVENISSAGIIPNSVISKVIIQKTGGGTTYLEDATIESFGSNIFLDLAASPVFVPNQSSVTVDVKLEISSSCYATNFQLNLSATNSITAKDQILNTDVTVYPAPSYSFPMRTGNADIAVKFEIFHDTLAVLSTWEPIIIRVVNTNGTIITNYTGTITLDTVAGDVTNIAWTNNYSGAGVFADSGAGSDQATYTFALADKGVVTLSVMDDTAETIDIIANSPYISGRSNDLVISSGIPGIPNVIISKTSRITNTPSYVALGGNIDDPVPGAKIIYTINYSNAGTGNALDYKISDTIRSFQTYNPGSMNLNGSNLTDISDADEGDFNVTLGNSVTVIITNIAPNETGYLKFEVLIK